MNNGTIGRNDPCWCGSGLKYKKCHLTIDASQPSNKLTVEHDAYVDRWKGNSTTFEGQGCYDWMAEKIARISPRLILDIGCGDGTGIKHLVQAVGSVGLRVFAIDENPRCLQAAKDNLHSAGIETAVIERVEVIQRQGDDYDYIHRPIPPHTPAPVVLIQSDLLSDPYIENYLKSQGKFDAVTIWLIGTHLQRQYCTAIQQQGIRDNGTYRLFVQNRTYELADNLLRQGGLLQVVDRTQVPETDYLKDDYLNSHKDQASPTSLDVFELDYFLYKEPIQGNRVAMNPTLGRTGVMPDLSQLAMSSVLSRKR